MRRNLVELSVKLANDIARMVCMALFARRSTIEKCREIMEKLCRRGGVISAIEFYSAGGYVPTVLRKHNVVVTMRDRWNNYYYVSRVCGAHGLLAYEPLQRITLLLLETVISVKMLNKLKRRAKDGRPIRSHEECVELTLKEIRKQAGPLWRIARIMGKERLQIVELVFRVAADCFCKELLGEIDKANLTGEERRKAVVQAMKGCLEDAKTRLGLNL